MRVTSYAAAFGARPCSPLAVVAIVLAGSLCAAPVRADDLTVHWSAPPNCPDRESLRLGLSQRLGRPVSFGPAAALQLSATITPRPGGYALELQTRSANNSEERHLQARSCTELARASLMIAALLLGADPGPAELAAVSGSATAKPTRSAPRTWSFFVRAGLVGDLGTLAGVSFGPSLGVGIAVHSTRFELAGLYLPPQQLSAPGLSAPASASLRLAAGSIGACQEFFTGPTLAPCLRFEAGQLRGQGEHLESTLITRSAWLAVLLGARAGIRLFDFLQWSIELAAGLPWIRPTFAIHGVGPVHEVPAVFGRLETNLEARF
jgi:hypothetical protein